MSADICPKCNEQFFRDDSCEACGYYDSSEELRRLRARIAELEIELELARELQAKEE